MVTLFNQGYLEVDLLDMYLGIRKELNKMILMNTKGIIGRPRDISKTTTVHGSWLLSRDSVRRLEQLKFDPILRMVQQYDRLEEDIYNLTHNPDGSYKEKFSHMAYSSMALIQQKIANDLIRYGYARVTETTNVNNNNVGPLMIQLTDKSDEAGDNNTEES
jgi:hypothetical protein